MDVVLPMVYSQPLSVRDYFAGLAMQEFMANNQGFLSNPDVINGVAKDAYEIADAMLAARGPDPLPVPIVTHNSMPHMPHVTLHPCADTVEEPDVRPECPHCHHAMNFHLSHGWACFNPMCGKYE